MTLVIKTSGEQESSPHLAITHAAQGFSANNRHVSLLMKSVDELSDEVKQQVIKALENLGIKDSSEINKAAFYSQMRNAMQEAVKEKFGDDKEWIYVEDFNDEVVVFCNEKGLYIVNYTSNPDGSVELEDLATPATSNIVYVPQEGKMLLSEDAEDKLEEGVYSLMKSCVESSTTVEHLQKMFEHKHNEEIILQEEIQKAVAEVETLLKAQVADLTEKLEKAQAKVAEYEQAEKEAVEKARKDAIASVEKDEAKAEELFKSLEALSQDAFDVVIKSLKAKEEKLEDSDLFVQKSKNSDVEHEEVNGTAAILKAKYAQQ
jgi:hypothetical protein